MSVLSSGLEWHSTRSLDLNDSITSRIGREGTLTVDKDNLNDCRNDLEKCESSPSPFVLDGHRGPGDPSNNYFVINDEVSICRKGHLQSAPKFHRQL